MRMAATKMRAAGPPYDSVYLYSVVPSGGLTLAAADGSPADPSLISPPAGIRGRAVTEKRNFNVTDVSEIDRHRTHGSETRSELVVLIRRHAEVFGEIDVECSCLNGFSLAQT